MSKSAKERSLEQWDWGKEEQIDSAPNITPVKPESLMNQLSEYYYPGVTIGMKESAAGEQSGGDQNMSENNYDLFLKDIKDDLREREARNEKRYDRIHEEIAQQKTEFEKRDEVFRQEVQARDELFRREMKEREDRILQSFAETKQDVKDIRADNKTLLYTNIAGWIAMILGVAAIVVTFITAK